MVMVKETVTVEREIHVAPCLECGSVDVSLSDCGYSSFNKGGGKCNDCGHEVFGDVGVFPSNDDKAEIWNAANDIDTLVAAEEKKITTANMRISELKAKQADRA